MKSNKLLTIVNIIWALMFILLFSTLSYVISAASSSQPNQGFQLGPLSAWFSGFCSLFTIGTAWYAFHSWEKNKYRDEAYEWTKKLILEDYPNLLKACRKLQAKILHLKFSVNLHHNPIILGPLPKLPDTDDIINIEKSIKK